MDSIWTVTAPQAKRKNETVEEAPHSIVAKIGISVRFREPCHGARQSQPQTLNQSHSHRKGVVNRVSGPECKGCPAKLITGSN
jgi:hypothetical protein